MADLIETNSQYNLVENRQQVNRNLMGFSKLLRTIMLGWVAFIAEIQGVVRGDSRNYRYSYQKPPLDYPIA